MPEFIVNYRAEVQFKKRFSGLHREVLAYLESRNDLTSEEHMILTHLKENFIEVFPYPFASKYACREVPVEFDKKNKLYYTFWNNRKLYLKEDFTPYDIRKAIRALLIEQDIVSPHRYLTPNYTLSDDSVVVDVGAAEGNFSLDIVEKAKKVFLIEADPAWRKALECTFAPWRDKVEIITKFASDSTSTTTVTVDELYQKTGKIDFVKIDVEGAEEEVIRGARKTLSRQSEMQIAVCSYHKQQDGEKLSGLLRNLGFEMAFSEGYMLFIYDSDQKPPYLRKGLIRAQKQVIRLL